MKTTSNDVIFQRASSQCVRTIEDIQFQSTLLVVVACCVLSLVVDSIVNFKSSLTQSNSFDEYELSFWTSTMLKAVRENQKMSHRANLNLLKLKYLSRGINGVWWCFQKRSSLSLVFSVSRVSLKNKKSPRSSVRVVLAVMMIMWMRSSKNWWPIRQSTYTLNMERLKSSRDSTRLLVVKHSIFINLVFTMMFHTQYPSRII